MLPISLPQKAISYQMKFLAPMVVGLLLVSCTLAPGLHFDQGDSQNAVPSSDHPLAKQDLQLITPEIVARQRQFAENDQPTPPLLLAHGVSKPYQLGAGDRLDIVVWDHPDLSPNSSNNEANGFVLDHLGRIDFPYVGLISAAGMTVHDFRERLTRTLGRYLRDPKITVRVKAFRSQKVTLEGELKSPGVLAVDDVPMTLNEAISRSGGYLPTADQGNILLVRQGSRYTLSIPALARRGISPSQIHLKNGDWLRIPSREERKVFVMGEVGRPAGVLMRSGELSLAEALSDAGGINMFSAAAGQIYVVRGLTDQKTEVFHLNARHVVSLAMADQFPLRPRDIVFVDSASVVRWNRVISLLLPSTQAIQSVGTLTGK